MSAIALFFNKVKEYLKFHVSVIDDIFLEGWGVIQGYQRICDTTVTEALLTEGFSSSCGPL